MKVSQLNAGSAMKLHCPGIGLYKVIKVTEKLRHEFSHNLRYSQNMDIDLY